MGIPQPHLSYLAGEFDLEELFPDIGEAITLDLMWSASFEVLTPKKAKKPCVNDKIIRINILLDLSMNIFTYYLLLEPLALLTMDILFHSHLVFDIFLTAFFHSAYNINRVLI